uniref:Uncharacterized protein n=2 Tax=Aegilops tauschii subsp. strangulata TaxID=200361 RepID=A0A453RFG1_AEGTS
FHCMSKLTCERILLDSILLVHWMNKLTPFMTKLSADVSNNSYFVLQEIMECNSSDVQMSHCAEGSETTIETKIKTLDSQTYNLHVNKCVS